MTGSALAHGVLDGSPMPCSPRLRGGAGVVLITATAYILLNLIADIA